MELSDKELLQFAIDSGMIDTNTIRKQIEMNERKKFIEMSNGGRYAKYILKEI